MPDKNKHAASGSAIAGAGATTGAVGLAAGGVPGAKSDFSSVFRIKPGSGKGVKRAATTVRGAAPAAKAVPGGILGFRMSAHRGGLYGFDQDTKNATKPKTAHEAFFQGRTAGKIAPEEKILRHMKGGRVAANAALAGGAAAAAYGVKRAKGDVKKNKQTTDKYNGAMLGAGAAGAGVSHGAGKLLTGQKRKWENAAAKSVDDAGKLVPAIAGRTGKKLTLKQMSRHQVTHPGQPYPKTMYPSVSDSAVKNHPEMLKDVSHKTAAAAGRLRGAAAQQRHFSEVYGSTAKVVRGIRNPSAVVAAAGAGGLAASKLEQMESKKKTFNKSAFGVEHG